MFTILELSEVLLVTKDRTKQILSEEMSKTSDLDIDKGRTWDIGPITLRKVYAKRGVELPQGKVIVTGVQKGGPGKTTMAVNIAGELGRAGLDVLLIDADPEAHASKFLATADDLQKPFRTLYEAFSEEKPLSQFILKSKFRGVDFIPSSLKNFNFERVTKIKNPKKILPPSLMDLRTKYNVIIIDVSPSMNLLTTTCYLSCCQEHDIIAMPVTPDAFSIESVGMTMETLKGLASEYDVTLTENQIKVIFNGAKAHNSTQDALAILLENYKNYLIPYYIKHSVEITKCNNAKTLISDGRVDEVRNAMRYLSYKLADMKFKEGIDGEIKN